jgi:hypothetical protein
VTTFVATSIRSELPDARDDLMRREKTIEKYIGFTDRSGKQASFSEYPNHKVAHDFRSISYSTGNFSSAGFAAGSVQTDLIPHDFKMAGCAL